MKTIKDVIIARYNAHIEAQGLSPNPHVLFDVICEYIQQNNFKYKGYVEEIFNAEQPHSEQGYYVNCFKLSHLMVKLSKEIGIDSKNCSIFVIKNFSCNKNGDTYGLKQTFDPQNLESTDGSYGFDQHCIAIIGGYCFDVTLQTKYEYLHDGINILNVLQNAIQSRDFKTFDTFFNYAKRCGGDINQGDWTLLHHACTLNRYEFVEFLLKNNANPYKYDSSNHPVSPNNILYNNLKTQRLSFSQKGKIIACLKLQAYDGLDMLNILYDAIQSRDFETFGIFFNYAKSLGVNINYGSWTLLHHACALNIYESVEFLLKNGASAYKEDNSNPPLTPLNILHTHLAIKGLSFSQKGKILACLKLQAEMDLKTQAARVIQAAGRGYIVRKALTKNNSSSYN